jgi:hypothetical protein
MKYALLAINCFLQFNLHAQKPCEYGTNVVDSIGSYKATKEYVVHERNFAGKSSYIFFSLVNSDGTPLLNLQQIEKSADFIKANCFDNNSKIYLQLTNGKVVTLIHDKEESCGTMIAVNEESKYSRLLSGSFLFMQGSIEALKEAAVSLIRIKYTTETIDYIFKKELVSELTKVTYEPENYFVNYLKCIE